MGATVAAGAGAPAWSGGIGADRAPCSCSIADVHPEDTGGLADSDARGGVGSQGMACRGIPCGASSAVSERSALSAWSGSDVGQRNVGCSPAVDADHSDARAGAEAVLAAGSSVSEIDQSDERTGAEAMSAPDSPVTDMDPSDENARVKDVPAAGSPAMDAMSRRNSRGSGTGASVPAAASERVSAPASSRA